MLDTMTVEMVETNAITFNAARGFLARDCSKATLDGAGTGSCTSCLHLQGHLCLRQRAAVARSAGSFDENVQSQDAWNCISSKSSSRKGQCLPSWKEAEDDHGSIL